MSNAFAIAAVTAVLKDILENGLTVDAIATSIGDTLVTALPPDRISVSTDERPQLNIFLYQVSQNRNADWVIRDRTVSQRPQSSPALPPLALDLHYVLTAYGAKDFQAELLLGYAMQLLHDSPVLTREMVYTALKHAAEMETFGVLSQALAALSIAELADRIGSIKLVPEFFSMEEASKLWSSLQTHYRPSAGYQASMVLIESRRPTSQPPLPPVPLQPVIEQVAPHAGLDRSLTAGDRLVIRGKGLQGTLTRIRWLGRSSLLTPQDVQDDQISLTVPPDLQAGVQGVQVVHLAMNSRVASEAIESNIAAFVVHPAITATVSAVETLNPDCCSAKVMLTVKPAIGKSQQVVLFLHNCASQEAPYRFPLPVRADLDDLTDRLTVPVQVKPGTYWVQLQVDGAQSSISSADASPSPHLQVTIE